MKIRSLGVVALLVACGTTGEDGEGDQNLPSAGVGPFRALATSEVKNVAPFVLEDAVARYRDPAVLRVGRETWLYAVSSARPTPESPLRDVIVRTRANDERTFFGTSAHFGNRPRVVLEPDLSWEGAGLVGPAVLRHKGEVFLYYSGHDGIGVARSSDGASFAKERGPILSRDDRPGTWETAPPRAPSVYALPDGRLRMLYASGGAIGEAESGDGLVWVRLGDAPVLAPSGRGFDAAAVGDPCASAVTSAAGRVVVRTLYTATDAAGVTAIGFAARFGTSGPLTRQETPAYSVGRKEAAPALLVLDGRSFLYFQQELLAGTSPGYVAIGAAVSPGNATLPAAGDYPALP